MTYLGETRDSVVVSININIALGRIDQKGMTPTADSVWSLGPSTMVTAPFVDEELEKISSLIPASEIYTEGALKALGFGAGFEKITVGSLCILPVKDVTEGANGIESVDQIWLPAAVCNQFGDLSFYLPEGEDVLDRHTCQFAALRRETDQADTAIPTKAQVTLKGPPAAAGLAWSLPAATP